MQRKKELMKKPGSYKVLTKDLFSVVVKLSNLGVLLPLAPATQAGGSSGESFTASFGSCHLEVKGECTYKEIFCKDKTLIESNLESFKAEAISHLNNPHCSFSSCPTPLLSPC